MPNFTYSQHTCRRYLMEVGYSSLVNRQMFENDAVSSDRPMKASTVVTTFWSVKMTKLNTTLLCPNSSNNAKYICDKGFIKKAYSNKFFFSDTHCINSHMDKYVHTFRHSQNKQTGQTTANHKNTVGNAAAKSKTLKKHCV